MMAAERALTFINIDRNLLPEKCCAITASKPVEQEKTDGVGKKYTDTVKARAEVE